jgi:hypothetical protein
LPSPPSSPFLSRFLSLSSFLFFDHQPAGRTTADITPLPILPSMDSAWSQEVAAADC